MFYTYIIYSEIADKYYVGQTSNVLERIKKHQNKNKGFTNQAKDWKIFYQKPFDSRSQAMAHEKEIKSWKSRKMIIKLIDDN